MRAMSASINSCIRANLPPIKLPAVPNATPPPTMAPAVSGSGAATANGTDMAPPTTAPLKRSSPTRAAVVTPIWSAKRAARRSASGFCVFCATRLSVLSAACCAPPGLIYRLYCLGTAPVDSNSCADAVRAARMAEAWSVGDSAERMPSAPALASADTAAAAPAASLVVLRITPAARIAGSGAVTRKSPRPKLAAADDVGLPVSGSTPAT